MSKKIFITLLMLLFASSIFAAPINMEFKYKKDTRDTYNLEDTIVLVSMSAMGQSFLEKNYELKIKSEIYERVLNLDQDQNAEVKSVVNIKGVYIDGKSENFNKTNDYVVGIKDKKGKTLKLTEICVNGNITKFTDESNVNKYRKFTDLISAAFVLPETPINIGDTWVPRSMIFSNNSNMKSEFTLNKIEKKDNEELAYISGKTTVNLNLKEAMQYFNDVIPDVIRNQQFDGNCSIITKKHDVIFSITNGIIKNETITTDTFLSITEPSSTMTMELSMATSSIFNYKLSEAVKQ